MKWDVIHDDQEDEDGSYDWWDCFGRLGDPDFRFALTDQGTKRYRYPVWAPSTNIIHAWEVVEKLGNHIALQGPGTTDLGEGYLEYATWTCSLHANHGDLYGTSATADTAALAICRAALIAIDPPKSSPEPMQQPRPLA